MPSITPIAAVPAFITPDEHTTLVASTPASFTDIPPVLRHKELNVAVALDPPLDGFDAQGTLYVIESVLVFESASGRVFQIEYPAITLHAISRADSRPSIYCQLDEGTAHLNGDADDAVNDMRELSIIPQNPDALEPIFETLSLCASLHPDPTTQDDMHDDDDAFIDASDSAFEVFTGDPGEELSEAGRAALDHLESIIYDPHNLIPQQRDGDDGGEDEFEDAEEQPEGKGH